MFLNAADDTDELFRIRTQLGDDQKEEREVAAGGNRRLLIVSVKTKRGCAALGGDLSLIGHF